MQELEGLGAAVCGISVDGVDRLERFVLKYRLPFTLLSDSRGIVAARYGSLLNLGFRRLARRNTFLIDPHGRIAKVYDGVDPARNAGDIVTDLRGLART
jgi:peroxiredoxin Q/BCP